MEAPVIDVDAFIGPDYFVTGSYISDQQHDLRDIVDGLFNSPPSASLGRFPTRRLMRQVKPNLVEVNDDYTKLDSCDVVNDGFTRVGRRSDEAELIPGLLGAGKWRRLKGGVTMTRDACSTQCPMGMRPALPWARSLRAE